MPGYQLIKTTKKWTPKNVASAETPVITPIRKNDRILYVTTAQVKPAKSGATSTITIGDLADAAGFMVATTHSLAATFLDVIKDGEGAYLASGVGKLYDAATNMILTYAPNSAGTIAPIVAIEICRIRHGSNA